MSGVESKTQRMLGVGRLEALTDGVFAIAITLLAIEIALPFGYMFEGPVKTIDVGCSSEEG